MANVVDMLDTIGATAGHIPAGTKRVAIYLTGGGGIAWNNADVAKLQADDPQLQLILRIDQSNSILSIPSYLVKDIELGASHIDTAVAEARDRANAGLRTCFYVSRSNWAAAEQAAAAAGITGHIDYWIADWNLDRQAAIDFMMSDDRVKAVQYASPSSNPNLLVPNSSLTLLEANTDLSVTRADWPNPAPVPAPPKRSQALLTAVEEGAGARWSVEGVDNKGDVAIQNSEDWHVDVTYRDGAWAAAPLPAGKPAPAKRAMLSIHPKVAAAASVGVPLAAADAILSAFGVKVPLTQPEISAIVAGLPLIAAYLKSSGIEVKV